MDAAESIVSASSRFPCMDLAPRKGVSYVTDGFCAAYKTRLVCFDCNRGKRLAMDQAEAAGLMTKIITKREGHMAKGNCECCGIKNVSIYRKGGVNRCYSCHKTQAEPMGMPGAVVETPAKQEPAPIETPKAEIEADAFPVSDEVEGCARCGETRHVLSATDRLCPACFSKAWSKGEPVRQNTPGCAQMPPDAPNVAAGSSEPSWSDFEPYQGMNGRSAQGLYAAISTADLRLSLEVTQAMDIAKGDYLAVAYNPNTKALAVRKSTQDDPHALKVSTATQRAQAQIAASGLRKAFGIELVATRLPVTMTSWGVVVHLSGDARA